MIRARMADRSIRGLRGGEGASASSFSAGRLCGGGVVGGDGRSSGGGGGGYGGGRGGYGGGGGGGDDMFSCSGGGCGWVGDDLARRHLAIACFILAACLMVPL